MRRATITIATLAMAGPIALAQPVEYGFDGDFGSAFTPFLDEPGVASQQAGGVLRFDTGGAVLAGPEYYTEAFASLAFAPRADESWEASLLISLPPALDAQFAGATAQVRAIELGLAAVFPQETFPFTLYDAAVILELYQDPGEAFVREYYASVGDDSGEIDGGGLVTGDTTATVRLSYDGSTRVLSAGVAGIQDAFTADLDQGPTDWGMADDDRFIIGVFAGVLNQAIPAATPVTIDDFRAELLTDDCPPDVNGDGVLDNGDIFSFVGLFLAGDLGADFNPDGVLDNGDIAAFVQAFLAAC
ncbi:MAG: GC-type dockerin domain-anchored protein [Phycisphaerales bacterium JB040]